MIDTLLAPSLPNYYVDRPEYSQKLKTRLLTNSSDVCTLVVTAIDGLASVGKSTLAMAASHDQEVQAHFCDGILWVTLGQRPNLLSLLSGWVMALGDYNFQPISVEATSNQLRTLLYEKAVLLIIDDVWNIEDAQVFNVGGAKCKVFVTTHDAEIAQVLGTNSSYFLDVMQPYQAMELLTKKLGRSITAIEHEPAQDLASSVGYFPLALELVAAEVASGTTWTQLLQDFQQEVARLKNLDRPKAEEITDEAILKRLCLTASLNLSIKRMPREKQEHFSWLGVLPKNVTINKMMAATLWKMDVYNAAQTLEYLENKAVLSPGVSLPDGTPTYRLHNLFHDLACNLLTAPPKTEDEDNLSGLGITLASAHATFLETYRNKTSKNLWHTLPNDGYIHQHLVWHLELAQKVEEIHELLREDAETGGNGWYEACARLSQTANFVTDVVHAWQLAEKSWTETTLAQVIGLQCRYALIIASLNSLTVDLPVGLLVALVEKNMWTPEQGLSYVLQNSNPSQKVNSLTQLANHLPPKLKELALSQALAAIREIEDEKYGADALSNLADKFPEVLPEALAAAIEIQDEEDRAQALKRLADKLPPELLPEAVAATREIEYGEFRASILGSLAVQLPELLPEAVAAAREIEYDAFHSDALSNLANKFPEVLPEALAAAREILDEYCRAESLRSLADKLPPELLPEAVAAARETEDEYYRAYVLISLADKFPELLPEAVAAAREIENKEHRNLALSSLADKLPPELLPEAVAVARESQDEYNRADALSRLADKLPELLPEALAATRAIRYANRAHILSNLVYKLPPELLPEAVAAARELEIESERADILSRLANKLPELLPEALAAAREIQDEDRRAQALSSLIDKLLQVQKNRLFCLWGKTLHILSVHTRPSLLSNINALTPIIDALGGEQALRDTASAIQDVSRWWR